MVQTARSTPYAKTSYRETAADIPADFTEISSALRRHDKPAIADRLISLYLNTSNESDAEPLKVESARHLASFILSDHNLGHPQIGMNLDGTLGATWRLEDGYVVDIEFLGNGLVRYAALGPRVQPGYARQRATGMSAIKDALREIRQIIPNGGSL